MPDPTTTILEALTQRLKGKGFVVSQTIGSKGYLQPRLVYFNLEYSMASGSRAHVTTQGYEVDKLIADEATISAIIAELNERYRDRTYR